MKSSADTISHCPPAPSPPTSLAPSPGPAVTGLYITLGHLSSDSADEFGKVNSAVFSGGYGEGDPATYIIDGVASSTSKTYVY